MSSDNSKTSLEKPMLNESGALGKREFPLTELNFEVVVVGAGPAGISAALSSARAGLKTALVTDRPVLGGSASSEVRVGPIGASNSPYNLFARETGILEEIWLNLEEKTRRSGIWRWLYYDESYFDLILAESNLEMFLNTSVYDLDMNESGGISKIKSVQLRSEKYIEFTGQTFVDCSGDGVLGYLSGADYRVGREERAEFNEADAPEKSDRGTMGATLLFSTIDRGHPVPFKAPDWALDVKKLPTLLDPDKMGHRYFYRSMYGHYYGFWWAEYGGVIDSIHDDDQVMIHTRQLIYGLWDYIKNSGKFTGVERQEIDWIGYLPGKRESRRLMGPTIVTGNDLLEQRPFDDAIGFCGWSIDTHPPQGYRDPEPASKHKDVPALSDIPLTCLFSRNIENLWFAGRNVSCTHEGLGSLRVIATGAVMGQAAGEAAAYATKNKLTPRQVASEHIKEIQRLLSRKDQSITGYQLLEENDLSRSSRILASSERELKVENVEQYFTLQERLALILPINTPKLEKISFYAEPLRETEMELTVFATDEAQNYRFRQKLGVFKQKIDKEGWVDFNIDAVPGPGMKLFFVIEENPSLLIGIANTAIPGAMGLTLEKVDEVDEFTRLQPQPFFPAFRCSPELSLFKAENVIDGFTRPHGLPHCWCSEELDPSEPQQLSMELKETSSLKSIEIVFDSNLNLMHGKFSGMPRELARDYDVFAIKDGTESRIVKARDNIKRLCVHDFEAIEVDAVKLVVYRTWGAKHVSVYDMRLYS